MDEFMDSLQIAFEIVMKWPLSSLWLVFIGFIIGCVIWAVIWYRDSTDREIIRFNITTEANANAREIVAKAKEKAEAEAKEIIRKAEYKLSQVEMECDIRKSKIEAWLRHLEKTEANSRRMKEIVKGLLKHARRIKAEVDLAKKKDAREPSIRNIRQACLRMLKLDEEADEIDKTIGQRPETF